MGCQTCRYDLGDPLPRYGGRSSGTRHVAVGEKRQHVISDYCTKLIDVVVCDGPNLRMYGSRQKIRSLVAWDTAMQGYPLYLKTPSCIFNLMVRSGFPVRKNGCILFIQKLLQHPTGVTQYYHFLTTLYTPKKR